MKPRPSTTLTLAAAIAGLVLTAVPAKALDNPGFEVPDQGVNGFAYSPAGASWAFTPGKAGLSGPNGPWRSNSTSPDPLGDQFGYLQDVADISQDLTGLLVGTAYELSFFESYRTGTIPSNDLAVILDAGLATELTIYYSADVSNPTWETRTTDQFVAAKDSYKLTFRTTNPLGAGDRTTIIDGVVTNTVVVPGAPVVDTLSPADNASDVPTYSDLVVTFNKGVFAAGGNITIKNLDTPSQIVIPVGDPRVSVAGAVLRINPSADLAALTDFAVVIDPGAVEDAEGTPFAGIPDDGSWTFATAALDTTPPVVTTLSPVSGASNVPPTGHLVLTFDENVRKGTGTIVIRRLNDDSVVETIDVTTAAVTISGATATINPAANLDPTRSYYVEMDAGAIENLTGVPFAGITGDSTWNFITTAIHFVAISGDADSGISSANTYTHAIDFGDNVARATATINGVIFANGGPGNFPIGGTSQTVGSGTSNLPATNNGNDVAAPFLADAGMRNLVGDMIFNSPAAQITLTGLTPLQPYRFRLYHRPWTIGPQRAQAIAFNTDGVAGAEHSGVFDEDDASKPDPGFATGTQVNALTYDYTLPAGQTTLTVNINNTAVGTYHLYGLTNEERVDTTPPNILTLNPTDDAGDVPTYSNLVVTFDEPIATGTGTITIRNVTDGGDTVIPAGDPRVSVSGPVLTINPDTNLAGLKEFAVLIAAGAVEDLSGNPFGGIADDGRWTFTTGVSDFAAPTVVTLNPADDTVDASTWADLVVTFNEPVQKGTGNIVIKRTGDGATMETIDVNSGAVTINGPDLTIARSVVLAATTGYHVQIDPGAVQDLYGNAHVGITGTSAWSFTTAVTNEFTVVQITGDADSGINSSTTYTHKLDLGQGNPGAVVNGVQFDAYNNAANGTLNFNREAVSGALSDHAGNGAHNVTGGLANLLTDMFYNGGNAPGGTTTWTLSGLTAGVTYDTRVYTRQWGLPAARFVTLIFDPDGTGPISDSTGLINEDDATSVGMAADNDAYFINYRFTAVAGEDLVITAIQRDYNYSWHLYGLSNEVVGSGGDYGAWELRFPGANLVDPGADFDRDGLSNDTERLFGLDPTDPASLNPITAPLDPAAGTLDFTRRAGALTGLTYTVWTSTDLLMWTKDSGAVLTAGAAVDEVETVAVTLSAGLLTAPTLFVQIRAAALFSADFEANDGGFTTANKGTGTDWAWGAPNAPDQGGGGVTAGNGGSALGWGTNLTGGYAAGTDASLRSPVIDLTGVTGAALSFAGSIDANSGHTFEVNIIEDDSDLVIANLIPPTGDPAPTTSAWEPVGPIPLPGLALGQPVRIEWRFTGNGDGSFNGAYLDDVVLTETTP